jgi:hypothetical protein
MDGKLAAPKARPTAFTLPFMPMAISSNPSLFRSAAIQIAAPSPSGPTILIM